MILPIIFRPDLPSMANQVPDKVARKTRGESNTYVFDSRKPFMAAIHGQSDQPVFNRLIAHGQSGYMFYITETCQENLEC